MIDLGTGTTEGVGLAHLAPLIAQSKTDFRQMTEITRKYKNRVRD